MFSGPTGGPITGTQPSVCRLRRPVAMAGLLLRCSSPTARVRLVSRPPTEEGGSGSRGRPDSIQVELVKHKCTHGAVVAPWRCQTRSGSRADDAIAAVAAGDDDAASPSFLVIPCCKLAARCSAPCCWRWRAWCRPRHKQG